MATGILSKEGLFLVKRILLQKATQPLKQVAPHEKYEGREFANMDLEIMNTEINSK